MMKLKGLRDFLGRKSGTKSARTVERQDNRNSEPASIVPAHQTETTPAESAQQEQTPATDTVREPAANVPAHQTDTTPAESAQQEQTPATDTVREPAANVPAHQTEIAPAESAQQEQTPAKTVREPTPLQQIDAETRTEAKRCLEQFMSQAQGLHGAIVSSIDGNDLLAVLKREMPTNRLSGMTSSLLALGETVARESGQKSCQFVIVENSAGRVVCLRINRTLMLTCISSPDMSLGMLLSSGRQTADNLGKVFEKGGLQTA
ncbi:MAG: hypothetical protein R3F53_20305 [Gammaproteobacteria bacterium]